MALVFDNKTNDISTDAGGSPTIGGAAAGGGTLQVDTTCVVQPADEGSVSGNARGLRAVELQMCRSAATQIALGPNSFIGGGACNSVCSAAACSVIAGGQGNIVHKQHSVIVGGSASQSVDCLTFIGGGYKHTIFGGATGATVVGGQCHSVPAAGKHAFIGGGCLNRVCGCYGTVVGGFNNFVCSTSNHGFVGGGTSNSSRRHGTAVVGGCGNVGNANGGFIGGGFKNTVTGYCSAIAGGCYNSTLSVISFIPGGSRACTTSVGQGAHASGWFSAAGDSQHSDFVARKQTTDATCQELFLDGSSARLKLDTNDQLFSFKARVVGKHTTADSEVLSKEFLGVIERNSAGVTAFVNDVGTNVVADTTSGVWSANVFADDTNDALGICVSGTAANVNWVSHITTVEVKT